LFLDDAKGLSEYSDKIDTEQRGIPEEQLRILLSDNNGLFKHKSIDKHFLTSIGKV